MKRLNILPSNPETESEKKAVGLGRFPSWLHYKLPSGSQMFQTDEIVTKYRLNTVCEEAKCPNRLECYTKRTATFLALGTSCTRNCGFCNIDFSKTPAPPEVDEPRRIALSIKELGLTHVVITMVARDDLEDGGAHHMSRIVRTIRSVRPDTTIEVLPSDFAGNRDALDLLLNERPEIFNHNIETVRALTPRVRHRAEYDRSLSLLKYAKESAQTFYVKSAMMLGLGETKEEVHETIRDLFNAGCDIIAIGQYLQPNSQKLRVKEFITPEQFKSFEEYGLSLGVKYMYCGPFVRSSYNANLFVPGKNTPIESC
jgi:lipoic acid synthetase